MVESLDGEGNFRRTFRNVFYTTNFRINVEAARWSIVIQAGS